MTRTPTFSLNPGPSASCQDCGHETRVKLGGLLGSPKLTKWAVSPELLHALYLDCYRLIRRGVLESSGKVGLYLTCPFCERAKRKDADSPKAAKIVWVALDGDVGVLPDSLAGPFCSRCLKDQRKLFEHADGSTFDPPVYYVLPPPSKWLDELMQHFKDRRNPEVVEVAAEDLF